MKYVNINLENKKAARDIGKQVFSQGMLIGDVH